MPRQPPILPCELPFQAPEWPDLSETTLSPSRLLEGDIVSLADLFRQLSILIGLPAVLLVRARGRCRCSGTRLAT